MRWLQAWEQFLGTRLLCKVTLVKILVIDTNPQIMNARTKLTGILNTIILLVGISETIRKGVHHNNDFG